MAYARPRPRPGLGLAIGLGRLGLPGLCLYFPRGNGMLQSSLAEILGGRIHPQRPRFLSRGTLPRRRLLSETFHRCKDPADVETFFGQTFPRRHDFACKSYQKLIVFADVETFSGLEFVPKTFPRWQFWQVPARPPSLRARDVETFQNHGDVETFAMSGKTFPRRQDSLTWRFAPIRNVSTLSGNA